MDFHATRLLLVNSLAAALCWFIRPRIQCSALIGDSKNLTGNFVFGWSVTNMLPTMHPRKESETNAIPTVVPVVS